MIVQLRRLIAYTALIITEHNDTGCCAGNEMWTFYLSNYDHHVNSFAVKGLPDFNLTARFKPDHLLSLVISHLIYTSKLSPAPSTGDPATIAYCHCHQGTRGISHIGNGTLCFGNFTLMLACFICGPPLMNSGPSLMIANLICPQIRSWSSATSRQQADISTPTPNILTASSPLTSLHCLHSCP